MRIEYPNVDVNLVDYTRENEECVRHAECCECVRNARAHTPAFNQHPTFFALSGYLYPSVNNLIDEKAGYIFFNRSS